MSARRLLLAVRRPTASRSTNRRGWIVLAVVVLMSGCGSEDFPGAPGGAGDLDVPYVTTYNFGFQVGFDPIFGANGNLQIISGSDLNNLISAANVTRRPGTGVIGGRVFSFAGIVVNDVLLAATDVNGDLVGEFFYNSLGGTPDFVQTRGTSGLGGFTALNVDPGEVFLTAVAGGRGGNRVLSFPDEVSLTTVVVTPVVIPVIGVVGQISDDVGREITSGGASIDVEVVGQRIGEAANCADETPTQDRVDARQETTVTAFRFCVASDGDYFVRLTGDERFITTYDTFNSDSTRLTALQTAELTEFFTIQTRAGLDAAATATGTPFDPAKGIVVGQVRFGAGAPRSGGVVRITDEAGNSLAATGGGVPNMGAIVYLDGAARPNPDAVSTGDNGRFLAWNLPIPPGATGATVYLTVTAERETAGVPDRYVATSIIPIFPNAAMFRNLDTVLVPPPVPGEAQFDPYFTGPVSGRVMREDGLAPVGNARVTPLGVPIAELPPPQQSQVFVADANGNYNIPLNQANPDATTPLLQSSTYLVKAEGPSGSNAYLPTFQRLETGTAEVDTTTGQFKEKIQSLVVVTRQAINEFRGALGLDPNDETWKVRGTLLGTAVDASTGRPAAGISIRLTPVDATEEQTARIYYFDFGGVPRSDLTATTPDGRFIVFNAPVGAVSLDVTSPDDTGNAVADSRADGVTVVRLSVNNAPPQAVDVSGRFAPLAGSLPSTVISLTAAGGDPMAMRRQCPTDTFEREGLCYRDPENRQGLESKVNVPCSDIATYGPHRRERDGFCQLMLESTPGGGTFTVPVGSYRETVLKTSGPGLMDTYTFGLQTTDRAMGGVSVGAVTTDAVNNALPPGLTRVDETAVIWGQATTASLGEVDQNGNLAPRTCAQPAWTALPDNTPVWCDRLPNPGALVAGSFNDDAFRDLAIIDLGATSSTPTVTIWLNTGDGSFVLADTIGEDTANCRVGDPGCGVEDGPAALLVVDYTRDGLSDLVVLNQGARTISLLEGRGRGRFVFGGSLAVGLSGTVPTAMAAADFNRDQRPDLLITHSSGEIGLLIGTGAGFQPPSPGARVGIDPRAVIPGALDFDGIPDLVFVTCESIWLMQEIGRTNKLTEYRIPGDSSPECDAADFSAAAVGDVDGSGFNDVVVADRASGAPKIWIFPNGPFGLETPTQVPALENPIAVAAIDLNKDRHLDLVVVHQDQDGTVMYQEGDGVGGFGQQRLFQVGGRPVALVMDDVTGDGVADAVLSDPGSGSGRIVILPQTTRAVDGVAVAAVQANGQAVGDVVYLNEQGAAVSGATVTAASGRFAIFNVPPGPIWLRLLSKGLGSRFLHAYANAVTNTTFPVITGQSTTVSISGVTVDAVVRPVGEVQIRFLGTQRATSSNPILFDSQGNATGGADYRAIIEANSDYVIQLSK